MTAKEIIDYARSHPDHPVSVTPANWAALVELFDSQAEQIKWFKAKRANPIWKLLHLLRVV